jgi:uncharacterized protein YjiS (DUF1127 family)
VAELTLRRAPTLVVLSARATVGRGTRAAMAEAVFRDELLRLFDDVGEVAWRQARRARLELGAMTAPNGDRAPARRHRVKA